MDQSCVLLLMLDSRMDECMYFVSRVDQMLSSGLT